MDRILETVKAACMERRRRQLDLNDPDLMLAIAPYVNKLAEMKSPEEIRDFLVSEGVKARLASGHQCAVAAYIRAATGKTVSVSYGAVNCYEDDRRMWLPLNSTVLSDFIWDFDGGKYPELLDEDSRRYVEGGGLDEPC